MITINMNKFNYIHSKKDSCFVMTPRGIVYGPNYDFLEECPCDKCKFNVDGECVNSEVESIDLKDCKSFYHYWYGIKIK